MWYDLNENQALSLNFGGEELILTGLGVLLWPAKKMLIVADLHLEKGSYFAKRGNPLPLYDTRDTLNRLATAIALYKPEKLLTLGDNMHDSFAMARMNVGDLEAMQDIRRRVVEWLWLSGNHDYKINNLPLENMNYCDTITMQPITFSHDFADNVPFQIVGHYHPKTTIKNIAGRCFVVNAQRLIMPSFGSYTGGLNIQTADFTQIMLQEKFNAYLLHRSKIWRVQ